MGQRLNIEILYEGEAIANCYYHWSAYTGEALRLARKIIKAIPWKKPPQLRRHNAASLAVELLMWTGASFNMAALAELENGYDPKVFCGVLPLAHSSRTKDADRNKGLIAVTPGQMKETRDWEEGRVEIDLARGTALFNVFGEYDEDCDPLDMDEAEIEARVMDIGDLDPCEAMSFEQLVELADKYDAFRKEKGFLPWRWRTASGDMYDLFE